MAESRNSIPVTILMPVYNGEPYLRETIGSFLAQTFADFELLVVNDCSTDRTAEIVTSYQDIRIRVLHNEQNLKISRSINRGLEEARGRLIALANHDDIFRPDRIEKQVAFLKENPGFCGVGSWFLEIDSSGRVRKKHKTPTDPSIFKFRIITENPIANSSLLITADVLRNIGGYDPTYLSGIEDWDVYSRISIAGYKITNLPETLIKYRKYDESYSRSTGLKTRYEEIPRLIRRNLRELARIQLDEEETRLFFYARYLPHEIPLDKLDQALSICRKVTDSLQELVNCVNTRQELSRLETFLNLHLASVAMSSGRLSLARILYREMLSRGQKPLDALIRYCTTFTGINFWKIMKKIN